MFNKLSKILKIYKFAAQGKLKDGTEIFIDGDLTAGTKVYVITGEGNLPLPDGTYELEDGMIITVMDGAITDIQDAVVEPEQPVDQPVDQQMETEDNDEQDLETDVENEDDTELSVDDKVNLLTEQMSEIMKRIEALESSNADLSKENEDLKKQNENFSKEVDEFKLKLEKTNGADPLKKKVVNEDTTYNYSNKRLQALKNFKG